MKKLITCHLNAAYKIPNNDKSSDLSIILSDGNLNGFEYFKNLNEKFLNFTELDSYILKTQEQKEFGLYAKVKLHFFHIIFKEDNGLIDISVSFAEERKIDKANELHICMETLLDLCESFEIYEIKTSNTPVIEPIIF